MGKFMAEGGSFITLAKGNRSKAVTQVIHIQTYVTIYTHTYIYIHNLITISSTFLKLISPNPNF